MRNQRDSDLFYLKSIVGAIESIDSYGFTPTADKKTLRAVTYELMTIGEAATKISAPIKQQNSQIPWQKIEGTRHRIVHEYFRIDPDMIVEIVATHLPLLMTEVRAVLKMLEAHP